MVPMKMAEKMKEAEQLLGKQIEVGVIGIEDHEG